MLKKFLGRGGPVFYSFRDVHGVEISPAKQKLRSDKTFLSEILHRNKNIKTSEL